MNADDERFAWYQCCGASGGARETRTLGEGHRSLNGLLEILTVEVRKQGARLCDTSKIRRVGRKVSDEVACN